MNAHDASYAKEISERLAAIGRFIEREGLHGLSPMQAYYVGCLIGETMRLREEQARVELAAAQQVQRAYDGGGRAPE